MKHQFITIAILFAIALFLSTLPTETASFLISGNRARRRRRARRHASHVARTLQSPIISLFGYEFKNRWRKINNIEFCNYLQENLFTNSTMIKKVSISSSNITSIAVKYMDSVYTPENFPYTWREQNETYKLSMNFTSNDVRKYYRNYCPYYNHEFYHFLGSLLRTLLFGMTIFYFVFIDKFHNMQHYY